MGNFFENLNDLFSTWAKGLQDSQKQNQQNKGAGTSAPSFESVGSTLLDGIGDAVSSAWTGFLNKVQESNKQNIQAGNYTTNPETVHLESPFGNHDNLMEKATAKPEEPKKKNPWEFENPFNDPILDDMYAKTVFELDEADPDMKQGTGIMKDAYDLTTRYAMDVFASDELLPEKDKRDPLAIAEKGWRDALDGKKAEYAAFGKSGKEIEGLLQAQEGWQTEKQHRESQEKNVISAAMAKQNGDAPYSRLAKLTGDALEGKAGENTAREISQALEELGDAGRQAMEFVSHLPYTQAMGYLNEMANENLKMSYEEADKYLREANPMYSLAKDTQGQMDDYAAAYGDLAGLYRRGAEGGYDAMTPAEQYAYHDLSGADGFEWLFDPENMGNPAGLSEDQLRQITEFGQTRAQQMEEAKGLFSPYEMTPYQQGLWEQYVSTPEGAARWAEDAKGTKDEEKARDNLWLVTREAKFAEIEGRADFQEISKPDEALLGKDRVYSAVNSVTMGPDAAQMWASVPNAMGMVSTASPETQHYIDIASGLDEHERLAYNAIVREQGLSAGLEYLRYKEYEVNERRTKEMATAFQTFAESGVGGAIGASALSVPLSVARGVGYLDMVGQNFANWVTGLLGGEQKPVDRYSAAQLPGTLADSAREGVQNQVDWNVNILGQDVDVFDFLYGTAMSGIDSFTAGQLGAALGGIANSAEKAQKLASWTGAAILGGGAAQSAMQDAYDRGANDGTALLLGAIAGANETLWEHWSIGNLIKHGQDVGKKTFAEEIKNAFAEAGVNASEEFNTSLANGIAEYFLNHDDRDVQKKADEYERLGLTKEAAMDKARGEFWASAVMDAAGGALMGGVFGSVENVQNRQNVNRVDKAVGSGFSSESMDTLYSLAESEGASDKAKKLARKFPKGKANAKQMGELFRELSNTMGRGIKEALRNMGVADIALQIGQETGAMDKAAAEAVTAMMQGENLNGEQVAALAANPAAMKIVDALFKPDTDVTSSAADAAPSPQGEGLEPVQFEPMPGMEEAEAKRRQAASAGQKVTPAETAEEAPNQERKVPIRVKGQEESRNITGLGMDGTDVRIDTDAGESISLEDADVDAGEAAVIQAAAGMENQDEAAAMIAAWQNGPRLRHQDAGPAQNMGANPETQAEAEAEPAGQGAVMSPDKETARADEARQAQDFAMGFRAVYEAAQAGKTAEGTQSIYADMLAPEARQAAEEAGRQAYERAEAQAEERNAQEAQAAGYRTVKNAGADAVGVLFDRVRDGIKQGGERVVAMLQMLDRAGREFGMQYRVVDKLENDANGKYVKGTNIVYIALDAEEGAITKAASHEGFHFISQFSPDMAKTIKDFVLDKLRQVAGYDIDQRIREVMQQYRDQAGQELTPEEATEEIVADSMLDVIGTRENMEQLMKQSKSTAEKIKEWITNTYQKFKDILNRLARNSPEVAALKDDVDYLGRISSMWQEGMRQAAEAYRQSQHGLYDSARTDADVQQYTESMKTATSEEDMLKGLNKLVENLYVRGEMGWIRQNVTAMEEDKEKAAQNKKAWEDGLSRFKQALLDYKQQNIALSVALERNGLPATPAAMNAAISYAARQYAEVTALLEDGQEMGGAEDSQSNGIKYSINKDVDTSQEKIEENWETVVHMKPVKQLRGDEFVLDKERDVYKEVLEFFNSIGGTAYNEELGDVKLNKRGIKDSRGHGVGGKKAAAFAAVKEVIEQGKMIDYQTRWKGHGYDTAVIAAPITIENQDYFMGVVVRRSNNSQRYYVHEVVLQKGKSTGTHHTEATGKESGSSYGSSYAPLKSILDELKTYKGENVNNSENGKYSLPSQQSQTEDAAEWVRDDAELYAQLKQDPDARAALWMIERIYRNTTTGEGRTVLSEADLNKRLPEVVKRLKEQTGATVSNKEMTNQIMTLWEALQKPGYQMGEMMQYARNMIKRWIESAPGVMAEQDETTKEILQELKHPFSLTPDMKSEIKGTFGDARDFYRKNFGKLKISNKALSTLADVWQETLTKLNPGVFAPDATEADMPIILDAWLETAGRREVSGEFGANIGAMSTDLAMNTILELFNTPDILQTRYEMNKARVDRTYQLYQAAERLISTVREGYKQKYQERIERDRQSKAKQGVINEIRKNVRPLKTMLVKGTDNRHIPEAMRGAMERMLNNLGVDRAIFSGQEAKELYMKLKKWAADSQLHDAAEASAYDPDILAKLEWLEEHAGRAKALRDMTMQELEAVRDAVQNMYKMVMEENEIEVAGRKLKVSALAENVMGQMKDKKDASSHPVLAFLRKVGFKEMTPVYYAKQVGGTLGDLINDIIRSESDVAFIIKDAKEAFDKAAEKYHLNEWIHDKNHLRFQTDAGDTIELTMEQAMTLYAWAEREKRNKTQSAAHLRRGGFTYDRNDKDVKQMKGVNFTKSHVLSVGDLAQIRNYLTDEQRKFVETMVTYLSENMAEKGNEASMRMFGWKKFGEKWYFPYPTDRNFRGKNSTDAKGQPDKQIKYMGSSHALTEKAMNPLKLGNFTDIWAGHVDEMARYSVMAEKLDNLQRVTNYSERQN